MSNALPSGAKSSTTVSASLASNSRPSMKLAVAVNEAGRWRASRRRPQCCWQSAARFGLEGPGLPVEPKRAVAVAEWGARADRPEQREGDLLGCEVEQPERLAAPPRRRRPLPSAAAAARTPRGVRSPPPRLRPGRRPSRSRQRRGSSSARPRSRASQGGRRRAASAPRPRASGSRAAFDP